MKPTELNIAVIGDLEIDCDLIGSEWNNTFPDADSIKRSYIIVKTASPEKDDIKLTKRLDPSAAFKGNNGKVSLAVWTDGTYAYSVMAVDTGIVQAEMEEIIKNVK